MPEASEPIAVNTGPLVGLNACGQIDLLTKLHKPVVAPEVVLAEFLRGPADRTAQGRSAIRPAWLEVRALRAPPGPLLNEYLDSGEAAVIALALEQSIGLVAIDERRGRMVARTFGLRVTGSIGLLLRAKREGFLTAIRPHVDAMREHGIWLSERLCTEALREAGEA